MGRRKSICIYSRSKKSEGSRSKKFFWCWVMLQCQRVRGTLGIRPYLRWERVRASGRENWWESRRIKVGMLVGSHWMKCLTWGDNRTATLLWCVFTLCCADSSVSGVAHWATRLTWWDSCCNTVAMCVHNVSRAAGCVAPLCLVSGPCGPSTRRSPLLPAGCRSFLYLFPYTLAVPLTL